MLPDNLVKSAILKIKWLILAKLLLVTYNNNKFGKFFEELKV